MDISVFLSQSDFRKALPENMHAQQLIHHVSFFTGEPEELDGKKLAIIGVKEGRAGLNNHGAMHGPDEFRKYFYQLYIHDEPVGIIDLGNIEAGNAISDTYYALNQTCQVLLRKNIIPVIVGGTQDLTYANYLAYENMEQTVNLVTMDYKLDFGNTENEVSSKSYLNKIVLHKPNYLFNYANIGHQRYMVEPELLSLMSNMYFDVHRLGDVQSSLMKAEPALRNADILSVDLGCIRQGESPGSAYVSPNGFYGEEAAQLCWYAGMSDKLTSFGIYEYNPEFDRDGQSAHLVAQLVWCFMDGVSQRKKDYPVGDYSEYMKFIVPLMQDGHELVFYKSPKTDRWWMDVPYPGGMENKYERHHLVPCTYDEYQQASHDEMPDRWWKTYQKLV
ncbi:MAG: formimidoylglutamase [Flavobacteriales bacterium]|nr:formimidoylglutamase [Flavobacteriales bacterium]